MTEKQMLTTIPMKGNGEDADIYAQFKKYVQTESLSITKYDGAASMTDPSKGFIYILHFVI
jgi:hypothetical protein